VRGMVITALVEATFIAIAWAMVRKSSVPQPVATSP
jgi:hypothetical protein